MQKEQIITEKNFYQTKRECPVCLSRHGCLLHQLRYPQEPNRILPTEYRIVGCENCGMVFDDFEASEDVFRQHYLSDGKYEMEISAGAGGLSDLDRKRYGMILDILKPYIADKEISIADIGCGKGGLLRYLYEQGYHNLFGLDASPGCIDFIRKNCSFPAVCQDIISFSPDSKFDIVLSTHVLEHIFNCHRYLDALRRFLKPGGFLYIEVPDASKYADYVKSPFYYFDLEHINHFQPSSLKMLAEICNYEPLSFLQFPISVQKDFFNPGLGMIAVCGKPSNISKRNDFTPIEHYIAACKQQDDLLQNLPDITGRCFLWGVGAFCLRLLEAGYLSHLNLIGLIDIDPKKQGKSVFSLKISAPSILMEKENRDAVVLITSVLYEQSIRDLLQDLHFKGRIFNLNRT